MEKKAVQKTISLNDLFISEEFNYRGVINMTELQGIAQSVKEHGLLQPVIVCEIPENDPRYAKGYRYNLLAGFRRTTAIKRILGRTEIDASIVSVADESDALCINIIENEERADVPFHQSAIAIGRLRELNLSEAQIIKKLGKSRGWVQVRMHYLDLPAHMREIIRDHNESETFAPITHENIRQLRTLLINNGEDICYEGLKSLRTGLCGGHKRINITKIAETKDTATAKKYVKHRRSPSDQEEMINTIYEGLSQQVTNPMAKALAWALGNITDAEFFEVCTDWAVQNGLTFSEPIVE